MSYSETENPWNNLADYFNTNIEPEQLESNAADNIYICWPVVLDAIKQYVGDKKRALDFGCGAGSFTAKLAELGFEATGVDSSEAMIRNATNAHSDVARFICGDSDLVPTLGKFNLITSIMALQFIEDVDTTIENLSSALEDGGIAVISVFNPEYAQKAFEAGKEFFGFDFSKNPTSGTLDLIKNDKVPTFIRDKDYYIDVAKQAGLSSIMKVAYPKFTEDFLEHYPHPVPTEKSEYMIFGFKK